MNDNHVSGSPFLDVRHLEMVAGIVEHGTLTKAAEALNLTQSALSHRLRNLEKRVGVPVFKRVGRTLQLSDAGRRLLATADNVLASLSSAETDVLRIAAGDAGAIRVSTECYTCYHWLPRLVGRFRSDYPGVDIQIVAEATPDPLPALLAGSIDLAIMSCPPNDPRLHSHELFRDELVGVTSPEHRLARRPFARPDDFADEHLILYSSEETVILDQFLAPAGVRPERISEIQITEGILELVKAGMGITALAQWAVRPDLESDAISSVRLGESGLQRSWHAVLTSEDLTPAEHRFLALLRQEMG